MTKEITEGPAKVPGWYIIKEGQSVKYKSPDGEIVGPVRYRRVYNHWKATGEIIGLPPSGNPKQQVSFSSFNSSKTQDYVPDYTSTTFQPQEAQPEEPSILSQIELPVASPTPARKTPSGNFAAKELSIGLQTVLVIGTSIIAMMTKLPEAQMQKNEVQAISVPAANLIERSKYNKVIGSMIVGQSDWLMLGYSTFAYVNRVGDAIREKRQHNELLKSTGHTQPITGSGTTAGNGHQANIGVPYARQGISRPGVTVQ